MPSATVPLHRREKRDEMTKSPRGPQGCSMHGNMCRIGLLARLGIALVRMTLLDSGPANTGGCLQPAATAGRHGKKGCA